MNIRKLFAGNLKRIRVSNNITQELLAEKLNINVRYIQQLEGKLTPNVKLDTVASLAKALKVAPCELLKEIK